MKKYSQISNRLVALLMLLIFIMPLGVSAATDTDNTTINATVASVITMTTSGSVGINITPVTGGAQSSASDTVTISTNNSAGFDLTLANSDATLTLTKGGDTIAAHAGTYASPTALANNSWGYAVGGLGTFDASYSALSNVTSSATKWAGVPASGSPQNIKSTSSTASGDTTTVWYSAKADPTKPNGSYTDTVTYTATTK